MLSFSGSCKNSHGLISVNLQRPFKMLFLENESKLKPHASKSNSDFVFTGFPQSSGKEAPIKTSQRKILFLEEQSSEKRIPKNAAIVTLQVSKQKTLQQHATETSSGLHTYSSLLAVQKRFLRPSRRRNLLQTNQTPV